MSANSPEPVHSPERFIAPSASEGMATHSPEARIAPRLA
jgi:hypothetical protein